MTVGNTIRFDFEVGLVEKHRVKFYFNQSFGPLRVYVDDVVVVRKFRMFTLSTVEKYEFPVGVEERHDVVIQKSRRKLMGGFIPQECVAFVDGKEVART
jgi:hypothetical protein